METSIEQIVTALGYLGIFLCMIANGIVSFPSSQILYIIAGYFIFTGHLTLAGVIIAGAAGNTIGNITLYEIVRRKGLAYVLKWKIFPEREVRKVEVAFKRRGAWFLFLAKLLPAIKVFAPIPAGLGKMHRGWYTTIIAITSAIWVLPFAALGYYFGKSAHMLGAYAIIVMVIALVVVGIFYRYLNSESIVKEVEGLEQ